MKKIVLLRHGQSTWNLENRFTGWTDVPLTEQGRAEAAQAGELIKKEGLVFGRAFTSYLRRAVQTLDIVLGVLNQEWIPVEKSWRLNEKHYGALQGLNKSETAAKYGEEQVKLWRRGYDVPAPALTPDDPRSPYADVRYAQVPRQYLPLTESLKDTIERILPYWKEEIFPRLEQEDNLLVTAHGNSLRGIVKYLKNIPDADIVSLNLPTGAPYVFEFDDNLNLVKDYFLGDSEEIKKRMAAVAAQGRKK